MPRINAIDLYAKYAGTFNRLRPANTLSPKIWNDLTTWEQEAWAALAIWIAGPGDGWKKVVFASDSDEDGFCPCGEYYDDCPCPGPTMDEYEYKEVDGVLFARRRSQ